MTDKAPQARWCSDACKQSAYRMRKEGDSDRDDNEASAIYEAPAIVTTEPAGLNQWRVTFDDGTPLEVSGYSAAAARTRARWQRARKVPGAGDP